MMHRWTAIFKHNHRKILQSFSDFSPPWYPNTVKETALRGIIIEITGRWLRRLLMKCGSSIIWHVGHSKHTRFTFRIVMDQFGLLHLILLSLHLTWSSLITLKGLSIAHPVFCGLFGTMSDKLRFEIWSHERNTVVFIVNINTKHV